MVNAHSSPQLASAPNPGRQLHILYAEDMREMRELMELVLQREGHTVECVENGALAWERLQAAGPDHYDLLITDHHMPDLNGLELVRRIRETGFPISAKIMVFSSELNPAVHARYRELGAGPIVPKPVFPSTLRDLMRNLFEAPA